MADDAESAESAGRVGAASERGRRLISLVWKAALTLSLSRSVSRARDDVKWEYSGPSARIMAMQVSSSSSVAMSNDELRKSFIRSMDSSTRAANAVLNSWNHTAGVHSEKLKLEQSKYNIPGVHSEKLKNALTVELQL